MVVKLTVKLLNPSYHRNHITIIIIINLKCVVHLLESEWRCVTLSLNDKLKTKGQARQQSNARIPIHRKAPEERRQRSLGCGRSRKFHAPQHDDVSWRSMSAPCTHHFIPAPPAAAAACNGRRGRGGEVGRRFWLPHESVLCPAIYLAHTDDIVRSSCSQSQLDNRQQRSSCLLSGVSFIAVI